MIKRIIEKFSKVNPQTAAIIFLVLTSLLLVSAITLTVLFAVDKTKYQTSYGTFLSSPDADPTIRYVVKGVGYEKSIRNFPRDWESEELVEIEYMEDKPESVRAIRAATPYVIAIIASVAACGWAVYIFMKYAVANRVEKPINDNTPTESGGYYS